MEEPISLTASEWRVMEALWDHGGQTIAQLTAALCVANAGVLLNAMLAVIAR